LLKDYFPGLFESAGGPTEIFKKPLKTAAMAFVTYNRCSR